MATLASPPSEPAATPDNPPPTRRRRRPVILVAAGVALLAATTAAAVWVASRDTLDRDTAQRECRTALQREAENRAGTLDGVQAAGVLVTLSGVDLQETWETDRGWSVNGVANYTMTTPLLGRTPYALNLTCEATAGDGGTVNTAVKNRT